MGDKSHIEWTDASWNPLTGCTRVSEGCRHCYAERMAARLASNPTTDRYAGVAEFTEGGPRWTGTVRFHADVLDQPLRWRKPRRVFVCSMSDLFHPGVTDEQIAAIFGAMAASPQHTFQVLTKRPERAQEWFARQVEDGADWSCINCHVAASEALGLGKVPGNDPRALPFDPDMPWPLPNVWLGTSVEDQATAGERIPHLLACPAAVRWVSYEPALASVNFKLYLPLTERGRGGPIRGRGGLDWIIVGGESGPGARPFDLAWARSTIEQCREAGVACFVKQLGARPFEDDSDKLGAPVDRDHIGRLPGAAVRDPKGSDPSEWPAGLRVREYPNSKGAPA